MFDHLNALRLRLSHEQVRMQTSVERSKLFSASEAHKQALCAVFISQIEKEIVAEITFLKSRGIVEESISKEMNDDELLAALNA